MGTEVTETELFQEKATRIIVNGVIDRLESREPNVDSSEWSRGVLSAGVAMLQEIATTTVFQDDLFAILSSRTKRVNNEVTLSKYEKLLLVNDLLDYIA